MFKEKTPDMQPLVFWEKEDAQQTLRGFGAGGRTRTVTSMTLEPKSSASTNFATPAGDGIVPEITAEEKFESISVKQTRL